MGESDSHTSPSQEAQYQAFLQMQQQIQAAMFPAPGGYQGLYMNMGALPVPFMMPPTPFPQKPGAGQTLAADGEASQLATPSTIESHHHEDYEEPIFPDMIADAEASAAAAAAAAPAARGGRSSRRRNVRKRASEDPDHWEPSPGEDIMKGMKNQIAQGSTCSIEFLADGNYSVSCTRVGGSKGKGKGGKGGKGTGKSGASYKGNSSANASSAQEATETNCPLTGLEKYRIADLFDDANCQSKVTQELAKGDKLINEAFLHWIFPKLLDLSIRSNGSSRLVQSVIGSVSTSALAKVADALVQHMEVLYASEHGNHVLSKVIEAVPSPLDYPFLEQIDKINPIKLARHRFGCRILERLIEHGKASELQQLGETYTEQAAELCRHQFGNFVIQHLLEHGPEDLKPRIVEKMLPSIQQLATHRTASHVVQMALQKCSAENQHAIRTGVVGDDDEQFREVACSRYGNYVVEELLKLDFGTDEIREKLKVVSQEQGESPSFIRLKEAAGLDVVGVAETQDKVSAAADAA